MNTSPGFVIVSIKKRVGGCLYVYFVCENEMRRKKKMDKN
jgi:hypothetical protein